MAGALALVAWELARSLTGSRRAATIATLLILTAGGMGWIRLILDVQAGLGAPLELVQRYPYDNTWEPGSPEFKIASILGTGLFPHRATTFGLPGVLSVLLLVRVSLGRTAGVGLAGVLAALLAPFHFYFFPATYLLVAMYAVARRAWRRRGWLRDAALFLAPIVLALPFVLGPALLQREARRHPARRRLEGGALRRGPRRGPRLLRDEPGPAAPARAARAGRVPPARPGVPGGLGRRVLPHPQRCRCGRGGIRHEQVLPGHGGRPGHPRRLAPAASPDRHRRARPGRRRRLTGPRRHLARGRSRSPSAWPRSRLGAGSPPTRRSGRCS